MAELFLDLLDEFHVQAALQIQMDTLGIEPRASRMLSGCDTTTPCAQMSGAFHLEVKQFLFAFAPTSRRSDWLCMLLTRSRTHGLVAMTSA